METNQKPHLSALGPLGLGALILCLFANPSRSIATAVETWQPELMEALAAYRAGDLAAVEQRCLSLAASARPAVRQDARALQALVWMHGPERELRLNGITQLQQLAQAAPALPQRPECLLALGIARRALFETSAALDALLRAADGFAARGLAQRQAAALAELAETWAVHSEWDLTPPRLRIRPPDSPAQADEIRRERVSAILEALATIPQSDETQTRVRLVLAQLCLKSERHEARGIQLLDDVARHPTLTSAVAEAILLRGARHEEHGEWTEAIELYERLRGARTAAGAEAESRLRRITRPDIDLRVPPTLGPNETLKIALSLRNVRSVSVEVRQANLAGWLMEQRGWFVEEKLPITGSLHLARDINPGPSAPHATWNASALEEPLAVKLPVGAYVVYAGGRDLQDRPISVRRLVIASDLCAAMFVGADRAALWAGLRSDVQRVQPIEASFWVFGSYVPTKPDVSDGTALFDLPPEARLMRSNRWICLVRTGEHVALCQGMLPARDARQTKQAVALTSGPTTPQAESPFTLAGMLLGPSAIDDDQPLHIALSDAMGTTRARVPVADAGAGVFNASLDLENELADTILRAVVRRGEHTLENVRGRETINVRAAGLAAPAVRVTLPPIHAPQDEITGNARAWYPWGVPLSEAHSTHLVHEVALPSPENGFEMAIGGRFFARDPHRPPDSPVPHLGLIVLDEQGRCSFRLPQQFLKFPDQPTAIAAWSRVHGWEGLETTVRSETLCSSEPLHAWLKVEPDEPAVGASVQPRFGWYDPTNRTGLLAPTVRVERDGQTLARLEPYPAGFGYTSTPWIPTQTGAFDVVVQLPHLDASPHELRETVHISPAANTKPLLLTSTPRAAHCETQPREVLVTVTGRLPRTGAAFALGANPLGVTRIDPFTGSRDVRIPIVDGMATGAARVVVLTPGPDSFHVATENPRSPRTETLAVALRGPEDPLQPRQVCRVDAECRAAGQPSAQPIAVLGRLCRTEGAGQAAWLPGQTREPDFPRPNPLPLATSYSGPDADNPTRILPPGSDRYAPALTRALYDGETLWASAESAEEGVARFDVPLPARPGIYRFTALARDAAGRIALTERLLDTRAALALNVDVPPGLVVGDRTVVAVRLENPGPEPIEASVQIDAGAGLHAEAPADRDDAQTASGQDLSVIVPPRNVRWIRAAVEALSPGTYTCTANMTTSRGQQTATSTYEIAPLERSNHDAQTTITLRRTIFVLSESEVRQSGRREGPGRTSPEEQFLRELYEPGRALTPGRHLLVREEFTLDSPQRSVLWTQSMPANGLADIRGRSASVRIGTLQKRDVRRLRYETPHLESGAHVHEYVIVAVRPGTCLLAPPRLGVAGDEANVRMESALSHIRVAEPTD